MEKNEINKIYGKNYKDLTKQLLTASDLCGEIHNKFNTTGGSCIGIKPNLVSPTPADFGATTHPEVVAGIIEYLKEAGFSNIVMLEGSWIGDKTSESYEFCGFKTLSETYDIPFWDMQKEKSHPVDCSGMELNICDAVSKIDFMINVPVLKGHGQTKITCALKNMKGLIPNTEKRHFHSIGLHKPIAHLSTGIHQDFIVVDHICGDLDFEDGGNPVERNCIMTAKDPVLMDSYVCRLLGYTIDLVPYVRLSEELGSGSTDLETCTVKIYDSANPGSILASFSGVENDPFESALEPSDKVLQISYAIEEADSCSACYASLAPTLYRLKEEGLLDKVMDSLHHRIAIGQGHNGKSGKIGQLGIGKCCRNYDLNIPGCPPDEEDIYNALKKLIGEQ